MSTWKRQVWACISERCVEWGEESMLSLLKGTHPETNQIHLEMWGSVLVWIFDDQLECTNLTDHQFKGLLIFDHWSRSLQLFQGSNVEDLWEYSPLCGVGRWHCFEVQVAPAEVYQMHLAKSMFIGFRTWIWMKTTQAERQCPLLG